MDLAGMDLKGNIQAHPESDENRFRAIEISQQRAVVQQLMASSDLPIQQGAG